jgi:hypothetical protein
MSFDKRATMINTAICIALIAYPLCNRALKIRRKRNVIKNILKDTCETKICCKYNDNMTFHHSVSMPYSDKYPALNGYIIINGNFDEEMVASFSYQYYNINGGNFNKPLTIIIRSFGGYTISLQKIFDILKNHQGIKTCYIHEYAFSCGTILALSCDIIYMKKKDVLSPIDTQQPTIFGCISILKSCEEKRIDISSVEANMISIGSDNDEILNCASINMTFIKYIMNKHKIYESLKQTLFMGIFMNPKFLHNEIFTYDDIKDIGFSINYVDGSCYSTDINAIIRRFFNPNLGKFFYNISYALS